MSKMQTLGIDIGSSSVKAAVLRGDRVAGSVSRAAFDTSYDGVSVEVKPQALLAAVARAIDDLGPGAKRADLVALSVMSPAWVAMDAKGRPITNIVTHQDRRSVHVAREIESRVGAKRHLQLAGNRPFPGSISSTTYVWFMRHERARLRRMDLFGHLSTFIVRQFTGGRAIDPSNASFTGVYLTNTQGGWSDELCDAVGVSRNVLPEVMESNHVAGHVTAAAARRFGLTDGTPVLAGIVDTSAAMLLTGAAAGQLFNVCGSTDVLALCTDRARPHPELLTRALGVGRKWLSVATIAAAGTSLTWAQQQLFSDVKRAKFWKLVAARAKRRQPSPVTFDPYLAGERTSIEQKRGAFSGLTLATTREDLLEAIIDALARVSAERLPLLQTRGTRMLRNVYVSGGVHDALERVLHRDWPGRWTFKSIDEATLRGLGRLEPKL